MKVKVRLQGSKEDVEKVRQMMLKMHRDMILAKPREGTNPKYAGRQKWSSYGDITPGVIRKRRSK
tara:strand:- start:190 stop:384 length:195 start_codon:yes stop_codon:yes gene_type:complete